VRSNTTASDLVELFIDDKQIFVQPGTTILQVC